MKIILVLSALLCALSASPSFAQLIDFETTPTATTPTDDAFLSAPYNMTGGTVAFFFDVNGNGVFDPGTDQRPVFERAGALDPNPGFANSFLGLDDTAQAGYEAQLGDYFLRQLQPGTPPPPFVIDYNTALTINALHGEIWDIDGAPGDTEAWKVEILDASNAVLTFQNSPFGNNQSLDGLPWDFQFTGLPVGVDKVRMTFIGSKMSGLGLAFNNFDPTSAPEPGTMAVLIAAAFGLVARRRRAD